MSGGIMFLGYMSGGEGGYVLEPCTTTHKQSAVNEQFLR